jgi:hypothetical protein
VYILLACGIPPGRFFKTGKSVYKKKDLFICGLKAYSLIWMMHVWKLYTMFGVVHVYCVVSDDLIHPFIHSCSFTPYHCFPQKAFLSLGLYLIMLFGIISSLICCKY